MTEEELMRNAQRMAKNTGIPVDTARAMILIGLRDTKRDSQGRLLADEDDIAEPGDRLTED